MKKFIAGMALSAAFVLGGSTMASAAPGGMPAAHGAEGKDWGQAVSSLAKMYPGAVADHIGSAK